MISTPSITAAKNSTLSCPYGWFASAGRAARRSAPNATRLATTLTTLSSASEYSAALPVSHHAPVFIASTARPTKIVMPAMRPTWSNAAPAPVAGPN